MKETKNQEELIIYDFSNLDLQENGTNNCFGFLDDDDCDSCDSVGCDI